ncbi:MAG: PEGA domain-containing protein [Myxococcaceae bacterium]|nr:PEGA domain-containing protein [Myxococcaceae bacterium]
MVYLDGKQLGQTPFDRPVSVPAGRHTVRIVNDTMKKEVTTRAASEQSYSVPVRPSVAPSPCRAGASVGKTRGEGDTGFHLFLEDFTVLGDEAS